MEIRKIFQDKIITVKTLFLVILYYVLGGIQYFRTYTRYYIEKKA